MAAPPRKWMPSKGSLSVMLWPRVVSAFTPSPGDGSVAEHYAGDDASKACQGLRECVCSCCVPNLGQFAL